MSSSPHTILADQFRALEANAGLVADPGDAGTFALRAETPLYCNLTIGAGSETRTLPSAASYPIGMIFTVVANQISGGSCTIESRVLSIEGQALEFEVRLVNGSNAWRASDATALIDLDGGADALVLDADGDTTISAPTDDQIDIELASVDHVVIKKVAVADSGATTNIVEIAASTPVDTTGTNTHSGLNIDLEIGNATGGTNLVTGISIDGITGDAQVVERGIVVGSGWACGVAVDDNSTVEFGAGSANVGDAALLWSTGDADNESLVLALGDTNQAIHITDLGAKATDWNVAAGTHPTVYVHSNTTPDQDYTAYGPHDGTDAVVFNVVGATGARFLIDGVGALEMDDAAITSFTAATDTAGKSVFIETQDAGGTALAARTGGAFSFKTGDGSANTGAVAAGAGGAITYVGGNGGANSGGASGQVGGAGGAIAISAGTGGATNSTGAHASGAGGNFTLAAGPAGSSTGSSATAAGAGGTFTISAGDGGAGTAGATPGGNAGSITLNAGVGGTSAGGAAGDPGKVKIGVGLLHFVNAQTIDMADAQVVLTLNPGTPTGTTLLSNNLAVDANSGATEDLLLPPEGDCNGLVLFIANTGGETINVKEDSDSTEICSLATAECAIVMCDGTTWRGGVMQTT